MESQKSRALLVFPSAEEANRRVAGVATVARLVRGLGQQGKRRVAISFPQGSTLAPSSWRDLERVAAGVSVDLIESSAIGSIGEEVERIEAPRLDSRAVLGATGKSGDGIVSKWLNRPVSRRISAGLLAFEGVRPIHATFGTAALATAMFLSLLFGGEAGMIAGGLLFHATSVFDGVDGEIARATFRTSPAGARIDTLVDMATNLLFVLGLTLNLSAREPSALPLGLWGFALFAIGLAALSFQAARSSGDFSLDLLKHDRSRASGRAFDAVMASLTAVTSRDFFAFGSAVLILVGLPMVDLLGFAVAATIWLPAVVLGVLRLQRAQSARRSA